MRDARALLDTIRALHREVRDEIVAATERHDVAAMAAIDRDDEADTIYALDVIGEAIVSRFADTLGRDHAFVLVAEGLPGGRRVCPAGANEASAAWWIIVDPIDGTRGLMYQKRSAWILTAVAPNRGSGTSLRDIELAVQTEIPLVKQHLCDQLWAVRGEGAHAERHNRLTGAFEPIRIRPSSARSIEHGFATIARFFPGGRDELAAIDESIISGALGPYPPGKARCFEDQYASTGGQIYELMAGHDRFIADLRPLLRPLLASRGLPPPLTCHPYDICCALIAEESGVIVTDAGGGPLDAPLNVTDEIAWAGYANSHIRDQIEPLLHQALRSRGWPANARARPATPRAARPERSRGAPDVDAFLETLRTERLFDRGACVSIARAPGRLDVMGGIADYSGSLVLERPIAEGTWAAVQRLDRPVLEIVSLGRAPMTIPLQVLRPGGMPMSYDDARRMFAAGSDRWVAYFVGVVLVLARARGLPLTSGARIVVTSQVPEGKGVSSSAAVETATMFAIASAFGVALEPRDLAWLCQTAENLVAGAPCGIMDQMTCVLGDEHTLLALLCQPAELQPPVPIRGDLEVWGIDSGERHAIGGSDYGAVRTGAFMGLRILSERLAVPGNYLANLDVAQFEQDLVHLLPEEMSGDQFLDRYGGTTDTVTAVERGRRYLVRASAAHPVYERRRVETFRRLVLESGDDTRLQLGELMFESHASYARCGLGSPGTDRLVELVREEGPGGGVYGARITGGGSGGTVAVIGRPDALATIGRIADAYERETGYRPQVFAGSSPGVAAFGTRSITL